MPAIEPSSGANSRFLIIGMVVVPIVVLVGVAVLLGSYRTTKTVTAVQKNACTTTAGTVLLTDAAKNLDPAKDAALAKDVEKIMQLQDYDKDANCLNVVTTYYINVSDYDNAKVNFAKLQDVYDSSQGFSIIIPQYGGMYAKNMDTLKQDVAFGDTFKATVLKTAKKLPQSASQ